MMAVDKLQQPERSAGIAAISNRIWFWLALHLCVWTVYGAISQSPGNVHHDMAEAFAWGREFELGYYKHPPFWAHLAGLWFVVMPRSDAAFYLLAIANATIGLWGAWLVAGRFLGAEKRLIAVLLLQFVPFFHFLALKYNANTILLSLWPLAIYFYLRMLDERNVASGLLLGVVCAFGMLSKYYFAVLLVTFAILALADPKRRRILWTASPWVAVATMLAICAPHIVWLWQNEFMPLQYVSSTMRHDLPTRIARGVWYLGGVAAFHVVMLAVFAALVAKPVDALLQALRMKRGEGQRNHLIALTILPHLLTVAISILVGIKIDTNFAIATLPLVPIILLLTSGVAMREDGLRRIKVLVGGFMACLLLLSPAIGLARFADGGGNSQQPAPEAMRAVEASWSEHVATPLRIVGSRSPHAEAMTFYATGDVSTFTDFSDAINPWVTQARIDREGIAVQCGLEDAACIAAAEARLGEPAFREAFELTRTYFGRRGETAAFVVLIYPPVAAAELTSGPPKSP
jgi:4-amino-4-deoxy-L-arabinose transferase-like glycosyltransferase